MDIEKNKEHVDASVEYKNVNQLITPKKFEKDVTERLGRIEDEFRRGFAALRAHPRTVTFFGSARFKQEHEYYKKASEIADRIANIGYDVITGGGPGIMEAANRGVMESDGSGLSIGFNIELPAEQVPNAYADQIVSFRYFFTRKVLLSFSAEAYLFFPGGFGTLDEFFEIITLIQTGKIERVPVICVGEDYWNAVDDCLRQTLEQDFATISPGDRDIYSITEDIDEIIYTIENAPLRQE